MTIRELQGDFQLEIQNYDQPGILTSDEIFYWLNEALLKFVDTYYSNDKESFEQTQKVTDILRKLVVEDSIVPVSLGDTFDVESFEVDLPSNYMNALNERVTLEFPYPGDPNTTILEESSITPATSNTLNKQLADPFGNHILHYESARPLRVFLDDRVILYSDGNYNITNYYLRYLRRPTLLALPPKDDPFQDFTDLPPDVHHDLVALAAKMYAETVKGHDVPPRQKELLAIKGKLIQTK